MLFKREFDSVFQVDVAREYGQSPLPKGSRSSCCSKPEFDSVFQVDVAREYNSVVPSPEREPIFMLFKT